MAGRYDQSDLRPSPGESHRAGTGVPVGVLRRCRDRPDAGRGRRGEADRSSAGHRLLDVFADRERAVEEWMYSAAKAGCAEYRCLRRTVRMEGLRYRIRLTPRAWGGHW